MVKYTIYILLYLLLGVKFFSHTLWIYCFCFFSPLSMKRVEFPSARKANPPMPYSTIDSSVLLFVLQVTTISWMLSENYTQKINTHILIIVSVIIQINTQRTKRHNICFRLLSDLKSLAIFYILYRHDKTYHHRKDVQLPADNVSHWMRWRKTIESQTWCVEASYLYAEQDWCIGTDIKWHILIN